jgi:hypothetical protein
LEGAEVQLPLITEDPDFKGDSRQDNADGRISRRALQITNKYAVTPKPSFANVVRINFEDKAGLGGGTLDDT